MAPQEIPEVDILPPQDDSATGWEGLVIRTERRINVALTGTIVTILDAIYTDRHYARFYMLETIARVPYFAYLSVLHVYESFGWWRRADYLKVHFAESWNELHHLLIMEALGGDKRWLDRFLAQHVAVAYYTVAALMYILSPRMAYHLNECVEKHAYHTYDKFVKQFGDKLKQKPAPEIAVKYYTEGDLYMFDEFQTAQTPGERRPTIENLYDVFVNIRNDEAEHCKTMRACQTAGALISPHQDTPADFLEEACSGVVECSVTATSAADRALKHGLQIDDRL
jgi:ubiquinol oxidase